MRGTLSHSQPLSDKVWALQLLAASVSVAQLDLVLLLPCAAEDRHINRMLPGTPTVVHTNWALSRAAAYRQMCVQHRAGHMCLPPGVEAKSCR